MEKTENIALWEKLAQISPDMFCTFDEDGFFVDVSQASNVILGYNSDELIGRNSFVMIHPDSLAVTHQAIQGLRTGRKIKSFENCFFHKNGECVYLHWSAAWSQEERMLLCVARDMTEEKTSQLLLQESEQRYKALFDSIPDQVYVQNSKGLVTEVNPAFLKMEGMHKEDIIGKSIASLLPPEVAVLSEQYLAQALKGKTMRFEYTTEKDGKHVVLDTQKIPIIIGGEITGVQTIARDITSTVQAIETIRLQAEKLSTIFESITDAFVMIDREWRLTYINCEAERLLKFNKERHIGISLWDVFPDQVGGVFYKNYRLAFKTGKALNFSAYLEECQVWLQVKAFPSPEGMSIYFDDITEQVRYRQELEKLSLVASKIKNSVIIMDRDRQVEWVNESFTNLTGYTLPEVEGKTSYNFLTGEETDKTTISRIIDSAEKGMTMKEKLLLYRKSGEKRWFEIEAIPVLDDESKLHRFIGIQNDVTERVKAQEELEKLSLVASSTDNGVVITDANGNIDWVNSGFTRMTGYASEEALGRKPGVLLQGKETDEATVRTMRENLGQGQPFTTQLINYRKSGEKYWVSIDITPIFGESGKIKQFISIQKDITFRKEAETAQLKMAKDLCRQNMDLQQFTYIVSHNLRAPVANVLGLSNFLTRLDKNSKLYDDSLAMLKLSAQNLDTVLRDLNTILSIRDSKGNLEREAVDLKQKLQQALTPLQERLQKYGGRVSIEIEEGLQVSANKAYLYSIFYNLLSNAIKYRSKARSLQVDVKCYSSADGVMISFADNGSGFNMSKAKDKVFKLYNRFHPEIEGRGIGLYLVKAHIEAMGGRIEVTSEVEIGTKFQLFLHKA